TIATTQLTANLLNTTATTVNFAGAASTLTIGAGTGTTTLNNNLAVNLVDNNSNALAIQESANNYLNVNTTDGSENITFGNPTTNPSYTFAGSGATTFGGNVAINGG